MMSYFCLASHLTSSFMLRHSVAPGPAVSQLRCISQSPTVLYWLLGERGVSCYGWYLVIWFSLQGFVRNYGGKPHPFSMSVLDEQFFPLKLYRKIYVCNNTVQSIIYVCYCQIPEGGFQFITYFLFIFKKIAKMILFTLLCLVGR